MMVLGKVITGYLADIVGRRAMWMASGMLTAIYLPILISTATPTDVPYLLPIFGLLYGAPYAVSATYMSESFRPADAGPRSARRSTISPILIGRIATDYSIWLGIAVLGFSYALCGLIPGLFIRENLFDPKSVEPRGIAEPQPQAAAS